MLGEIFLHQTMGEQQLVWQLWLGHTMGAVGDAATTGRVAAVAGTHYGCAG